MAIPAPIALLKTIKPMATIPAISTISIWIATRYPNALRFFPVSIWERSGLRESAVKRGQFPNTETLPRRALRQLSASICSTESPPGTIVIGMRRRAACLPVR